MRRCLRYKEDFYKMKKVIAFVSVFSNAFHLNRSPDKYYYDEDGNCVEGRQTNEAPLKYLLTKHNDINEIICLVSDTANKPPEWKPDNNLSAEDFLKKMGTKSPYEYLKEQVNQYVMAHPELFPKGKTFLFKKVRFKEDKDYFTRTIIPEILDRVHQDDIILLDTTGGLRFNQTQMTLLAKILTYQGTTLESAVYSEFNKKIIYDVTDSYRDFDLVNGLNEFGSTGATGMLESYFREGAASTETAKALVHAMKKLNEAIILARIPSIQERKNEVEKLLQKAGQELAQEKESGSSILTVLLPIFSIKYSQISTIPDLIKWCAANNLIQQAFTLYADWLPHYIMEEAKIITYTGILSEKDKDHIKKSKTNPSVYKLNNKFFIHQATWDTSTEDAYVRVLKNLRQLMYQSKNDKENSLFRYKDGIKHRDMKKMLQDYAYAKTQRNEMNHALSNEADVETSELNDEKITDRKEYLARKGYLFDEDRLDMAAFRQFLTEAMDHILMLAK